MTAVTQWLLEPLAFDFFRNALVGASLAGALCALVGTYVVLRGMAFLGDGLAHAALPGIAAAYLGGRNLFGGGLAAGLLTALGIGMVGRRAELKEDTAIGVVRAGAFALGVALISAIRSYTVDLSGLLFGDALAVTPGDLAWMAAVSLVVLGAVLFLHRQWVSLSFDPIFAEAVGLPVGLLHYALVVMLALTVVTAMRAVGILLTQAMLITPPATARLWTDRLSRMMGLSVALGIAAALLGLYVSYYLNIASGAAIVLVSLAFFVATLLFAPRRGVRPAWRARRPAA